MLLYLGYCTILLSVSIRNAHTVTSSGFPVCVGLLFACIELWLVYVVHVGQD